jgi:putative GTP pyrophosphokinase
MSEDTADKKYRAWYEAERPRYERLAKAVEGLLRELLELESIEFLTVESRAKTVDSFSSKLTRKSYSDPSREITDLCGLRIVTFLESDVERVGELVRRHFSVDETNSLDKSTALAVDRVGYRSRHYVCSLPANRLVLPEYAKHGSVVFEIQVRTALQHAWAQIEHDRNYKLGSSLPRHLQRRLFLAAGMLESADREFDSIAKAVDEYARDIAADAAQGKLDAELNSPSLDSYMESKFPQLRDERGPEYRDILLEELASFNIRTLQELDDMLSPVAGKILSVEPAISEIGFLRIAMMLTDIDRYFADSWGSRWRGMRKYTWTLLSNHYGAARVGLLLDRNGVDVEKD